MGNTFELKAPEAVDDVAKRILQRTGKNRIFAIEGPMGVGKTTLIKAFCRVLGVKDDMASPSFALINEYHAPDLGPVHHIDLYRIDELEEVWDIGLQEILDSRHPCFIEWPGLIHNFLPADHVEVQIEIAKDRRTRTIQITE